jgi:hypothetical protein
MYELAAQGPQRCADPPPFGLRTIQYGPKRIISGLCNFRFCFAVGDPGCSMTQRRALRSSSDIHKWWGGEGRCSYECVALEIAIDPGMEIPCVISRNTVVPPGGYTKIALAP